MPLAYFDFAGTPGKLYLDEEKLPERCELYDRKSDSFLLRDDVTPDFWAGSGARLIDRDEFESLLVKVREAR
ncbi:hypothetical protein [Amaricoccus solimangrovi]|uniref:Uncharacterized protein n=1 Tax=Amaricoccus solimangrovi TaxID=2589815 RepID=A0A501WA24_9RHOB|nr:hypothetical protein [Amaricoccus solimangrovi]TPE46479.1 hypothetical protein FJM51_22090 [Amaricoccus solimangrovi]